MGPVKKTESSKETSANSHTVTIHIIVRYSLTVYIAINYSVNLLKSFVMFQWQELSKMGR